MKILAKTEESDIATVYVAEFGPGKEVEFVESIQPPIPRDKKWVLIVSTLFGCPVGCKFCDSGSYYKGKLNKEEIMAQTDFLVNLRYSNKRIPADKFKIQFARMGEPALNDAVLDVLRELPARYDAPGLMPSVSTIAPFGRDAFFDNLLDIKNNIYGERFQMQFSIHDTNFERRDLLLPIKKWSFDQIANFGDRFYRIGDRKITLNFALAEGNEADPLVLKQYFNPEKYLVKITPVNPTFKANKNGIVSCDFSRNECVTIDKLRASGYETILSIGELEENQIGSNCGQHIMNYLRDKEYEIDGYSYPLTPCE